MSSGASSAQYEKPRPLRVELWAAHTQVEQDPHDSLALLGAHDVGDPLEAALHDTGPFPEGCERRARRRDGSGIPVDAEQVEVGTVPEDGGGVSAAADGGVDDQPPGDLVQQRDHLGRHHRSVLEPLSHRAPPLVAPAGPTDLVRISSSPDRHQPPGRTDESEAGGRGACAASPGGLVAAP